eukprot:TRINITY_DN22319_c0_g1_i1.p1 TRINITY_DN22319_c0_g1~~TRINITY_DN22319_c0_g1_i1.p1  ORF type:complete len:181 (+),score=97.36 TRINITY_DN22319_c0_g1_i1:105-647(+)
MPIAKRQADGTVVSATEAKQRRSLSQGDRNPFGTSTVNVTKMASMIKKDLMDVMGKVEGELSEREQEMIEKYQAAALRFCQLREEAAQESAKAEEQEQMAHGFKKQIEEKLEKLSGVADLMADIQAEAAAELERAKEETAEKIRQELAQFEKKGRGRSAMDLSRRLAAAAAAGGAESESD